MAWVSVTFQRNTDNPSIGTAIAVDESGFVFERRVDEKNSLSAFVESAQAALAAQQKQAGEVSAIEEKILAALNSR